MKNIKAFIFDMDGVLLDTESICQKTWALAGQKLKLSGAEALFTKCLGSSRKDTLAFLSREWGSLEVADSFMEETSLFFTQIEESEGIKLMPYVKECLDFLKDKYVLSLASSTRKENVYRELRNVGLIDYFKTITCGDMVTKSKPDPEIYLKASVSLGLSAQECLAVEDSPNGVKSAHSAGLNVIMVPDRIPCNEELRKIIYRECKSLKEITELF